MLTASGAGNVLVIYAMIRLIDIALPGELLPAWFYAAELAVGILVVVWGSKP